MKLKFVSIDPSLRNTGIVWGEIVDGKTLTTGGHHLVQTEKSKNKQVRVSSDIITRCRKIHQGIAAVIIDVNPNVIFVETPSGSQSSAAMRSYGICCALIAMITPPPIEITPQELKKNVMGSLTASKAQIISYVEGKYPNLKLPTKTQKGGVTTVIASKAEHIADAVCAAEAGLQTDQFKQLISILNK